MCIHGYYECVKRGLLYLSNSLYYKCIVIVAQFAYNLTSIFNFGLKISLLSTYTLVVRGGCFGRTPDCFSCNTMERRRATSRPRRGPKSHSSDTRAHSLPSSTVLSEPRARAFSAFLYNYM